MEQDILNKLKEQEEKIDAMYSSLEKIRKYFMWTLIITVVLFVLPLIGIVFLVPSFLSTYSQALNF